MGKKDTPSDESKPTVVAKTALELQRFKLEKLMKNPEKPVVIPDRPREKKTPHVPEFVRNVMGSSAGAGSGEFHVYRHLRRKEYSRQKFIQEKSEKQLLEEAYHQKLLDNKQAAEEKTAKKRAKRLRKKANKKMKKQNLSLAKNDTKSESESDDTSDEDQNDKTEGPAEERDRISATTLDSDRTTPTIEENHSDNLSFSAKSSSEAPIDNKPLSSETRLKDTNEIDNDCSKSVDKVSLSRNSDDSEEQGRSEANFDPKTEDSPVRSDATQDNR